MIKVPHKNASLEIGTTECPGCGAQVPLKVNVNGCVYYYCNAAISHDENGKATRRCKTRFSMNQDASAKMINDFLEGREKINVSELEDREEAPGIGHNGGPKLEGEGAGDAEYKQKSIGASFVKGLAEFVTGE